MICCEQILKTFVEESVTVVPYAGEFGDTPNVSVSYLIDGTWQQAGVFTSITVTTTSVIVDHGGVGTGVIRIS